MLVETYEVLEHDAVTGEPECDAEALALIDELGLTGQQKLLQGDGEERERFPYRLMTSAEGFVYHQLMPQHTRLAEYSSGAIPLRVLQVAAHAKPMFKELWVWHPRDMSDPVLVGTKGSYDSERYILARWGDVLESFDVLSAKAAKLFREKYKAEMAKLLKLFEGGQAIMDATPDSVIVEGAKSMPCGYL